MRRWAKTMGQCFVRLGEEQNSKDFSSQPTHDFPETYIVLEQALCFEDAPPIFSVLPLCSYKHASKNFVCFISSVCRSASLFAHHSDAFYTPSEPRVRHGRPAQELGDSGGGAVSDAGTPERKRPPRAGRRRRRPRPGRARASLVHISRIDLSFALRLESESESTYIGMMTENCEPPQLLLHDRRIPHPSHRDIHVAEHIIQRAPLHERLNETSADRTRTATAKLEPPSITSIRPQFDIRL